MAVIYIEEICDDEVGEVTGVFKEDGECIAVWATNDGQWRHEYFNGFLKALGIEVKYGKFEEELAKEAKELWG